MDPLMKHTDQLRRIGVTPEQFRERELALEETRRRMLRLDTVYRPADLFRVATGEPAYMVKEPPWWRPFARRRYRLGLRILNAFAAQELTEPPS